MRRAELIREAIELQGRVMQSLGRGTPDAWMDLNLTVAQLKSLFFITSQGNSNLRKLASALRVTPSNMTGIVDRLVEQGLVSRQENPEDRRMLVLQATTGGKTLVAELRERKAGLLSEALGHLSLEELETLTRGLASLARVAELYSKGNTQEPG